MYHSIFVPLDGSTFGEQALPLALAIARSRGSRLHLAHVHDPHRSASRRTWAAMGRAAVATDRNHEQLYLDHVARRLAAVWDGEITTALLDGPIALALYDEAAAIGADIVVLTTHGRGPLSRFWLGSVADRLVRQSPIPVLLVHPHEQPPDLTRLPALRHVLLPLDKSALAEQILAPALALGAPMDATYTLLQIVEPVVIEAIGIEELGPEQTEARAWGYLERMAGCLRAEGLVVRTDVVVADHPAPAILEYAQSHAVDLIAIETHGRGGLSRLLLGSVADKVLRASVAPMLLQHPSSGEPEAS